MLRCQIVESDNGLLDLQESPIIDYLGLSNPDPLSEKLFRNLLGSDLNFLESCFR